MWPDAGSKNEDSKELVTVLRPDIRHQEAAKVSQTTGSAPGRPKLRVPAWAKFWRQASERRRSARRFRDLPTTVSLGGFKKCTHSQ